MRTFRNSDANYAAFAATLIVCAGFALMLPDACRGTEANGVRNILYVKIKSSSDQGSTEQNSTNISHSATLTVKVRLSAHSRETNFYGDIPATLRDFDLTKGSPEQEVWKDATCHHERGGYPKMTVISVDGFVTDGNKKVPVAARYRWIGLLVPGDEIMPAKGLVRGSDDGGRFISTQTETKKSHLAIDLKMYTVPCTLNASAN